MRPSQLVLPMFVAERRGDHRDRRSLLGTFEVSGEGVPNRSEEHLAELDRILANTQRLRSHQDLETVDSYPLPVQRLIRRLARVRADRLVNQVL